jgi:hypothetical protein
MMMSHAPSLAELVICPFWFSQAMLSTIIAELPEPDTTVAICPDDDEVLNSTISPAVIWDSQLPV